MGKKLVALKGFNPDGVHGLLLQPTRDTEVYVVPDRALEILDVLVGGEPAMYRNPAGHRSRATYQRQGLGPLSHIEAGFTGGLENVGAGDAVLPLHGTFSVTPAREWDVTPDGGIRGIIDCRRLVTGPSIVVERTIEPAGDGRRAIRIIDELHATLGTEYMWLYHPNFPVVEGTRFVSSERVVVPRPGEAISGLGAEHYRTFQRVGEGYARFPRSDPDPVAIDEENFEKCYVMAMQADAEGVVRAALVSPAGDSAAYVQYRMADFRTIQQRFQFWKNPRDGSSGLEVGSTFLGWTWAREHGLLGQMKKGETHRYEIEIGFLRTRGEVDSFLALVPQGLAEIRRLGREDLASFYRAGAS